jgi:hypothetical protein
MTIPAFGNHPSKIDRYRDFWNRADARRPMVCFSLVGWFPLDEFAACKSWQSSAYLAPEMIRPADFIEDHLRMLREGEVMDDDAIRGACPGQVAIPWLPAALGCRMRILPENVLGEERCLPWEEALSTRLDPAHPWFEKYIQFAQALVEASSGAFPVSHSAELGPTDLHAVLRGHTQSIIDLADQPENSSRLLEQMGGVCLQATEEIWKHLPLYHGGYFDAQYSLWSPSPIIRMQEDATAVYSPPLYRRFVQPVDRTLARHFPSSFMHLHSTSMFLLDAILAIGEIQCFEVNNDVAGPPLPKMVTYFQRIQTAGKPLLIRGSFTPEEMRLLMDSLDPRGLFLNVMVQSMNQVEPLRPILKL